MKYGYDIDIMQNITIGKCVVIVFFVNKACDIIFVFVSLMLVCQQVIYNYTCMFLKYMFQNNNSPLLALSTQLLLKRIQSSDTHLQEIQTSTHCSKCCFWFVYVCGGRYCKWYSVLFWCCLLSMKMGGGGLVVDNCIDSFLSKLH